MNTQVASNQETSEEGKGWHKPVKKETLAEVLDKITQLNQELRKYELIASEMKEAERQEALAQVRNTMRAYNLSPQELNIGTVVHKKSPMAGKPAPVKYRDKATGNTWTGRGLQPNWLKSALASGRKLEEFQV